MDPARDPFKRPRLHLIIAEDTAYWADRIESSICTPIRDWSLRKSGQFEFLVHKCTSVQAFQETLREHLPSGDLVANRARTDYLKPGGVMLPQRIVNLVELGSYNFRANDVTLETAIPLFTGIPRPAVMTERRVCKVLDFTGLVDPDLSVALDLEAVASGTINCAVLTSVVQMGPRVVFSGSDSLTPRTVVPLREPVAVTAGDRIQFRASVRAWSDMGEAKFVARVG
jgi:hypothetical protein